ncbi:MULTISPECIES: hypothetical protein [Vibrio]|uniref:Uncharacterized protein n=1 Tax=Vibrio mediterranei TaxID=689 RepID=A0ABX5DF20_9VIBR|nr:MULTISPECIES: hypothetical protein [Vibrio]MCF4175381.1 hypothetical protein [Vibrio sp. McD22-P3]PCD85680.1 hypothetical protein COR52_25525 [Vibrio mediterranei]PRQ66906.1 hypothetical protein COR51_14110 [Vibrio mediterranei]SBO09881.1 hypothetical protein VME0621_01984 [Vibrio mediterranei]
MPFLANNKTQNLNHFSIYGKNKNGDRPVFDLSESQHNYQQLANADIGDTIYVINVNGTITMVSKSQRFAQ